MLIGFLWARTYIYYCANEPISPYLCCRQSWHVQLSEHNQNYCTVGRREEDGEEKKGEERELIVCSMQSGTSSLVKVSFDKERNILAFFFIPQIYGSSQFSLGFLFFFLLNETVGTVCFCGGVAMPQAVMEERARMRETIANNVPWIYSWCREYDQCQTNQFQYQGSVGGPQDLMQRTQDSSEVHSSASVTVCALICLSCKSEHLDVIWRMSVSLILLVSPVRL